MSAVHALGAGDATAAFWVRGVNWLLAGPILAVDPASAHDTGDRLRFRSGCGSADAHTVCDLLFWAINGFETTLLTALFLWGLLRALEDARLGQVRVGTCLVAGLLPVVRADAVDLTAAVVLTRSCSAPGGAGGWWCWRRCRWRCTLCFAELLRRPATEHLLPEGCGPARSLPPGLGTSKGSSPPTRYPSCWRRPRPPLQVTVAAGLSRC